MPNTETLTIRMDAKDKAMLVQLADDTKRSKSYLAAQAIRAYVKREAEIVAAIHAGLEDSRAGRTITNEEARKKWQEAIDQAAKGEA